MKLHLPTSLRAAVLAAFAAVAALTTPVAYAFDHGTWDTSILSQNVTLTSYEFVNISNESSTSLGGAIGKSVSGGNVYTVNITDSGSITFASNTATGGGAVYCDRDCVLDLQDNLSVSFTDNTSVTGVSYGGAIRIDGNGTVNIGNSGVITFSGNKDIVSVSAYYEDAYAFGGAISNKYGTLGFTDNKGGIFFEDNGFEGRGTEWGYSAQGGALYNDSSNETVFSGNGNITFSGNGKTVNLSAEGGIFSEGGAICNTSGSKISFTSNGDITFTDNGDSTYFTGGAIKNESEMVFDHNGKIEFSYNTASTGAAIDSYGTMGFTNNGDIVFDHNSTTGYSIVDSGGEGMTFEGNKNISFTYNGVTGDAGSVNSTLSVLQNADAMSFTNNWNLTFDNNVMQVIANNGTLTFEDNMDISFSDNTATGNVIDNGGQTLTFRGNGDISFDNNKLPSKNLNHVLNSTGALIFEDNGNISFAGNSANAIQVSESLVITRNKNITISGNDGCAVEGTSTPVSITNNGDITISGNNVFYNAALYLRYNNTLCIAGNGDVTFRGNYLEAYDKYLSCLRALQTDNNGIVLSATTGKSITFYESVVVGSYPNGAGDGVHLNQSYENADGETEAATGAIVFTGETTEADLAAAHERLGITEDVRNGEITLSRKSSLAGDVTLHAGSLVVKSDAYLKAGSLTAKASADTVGGTKVVLDKGTLEMNTLTMEAGTTLQLTGANQLTGGLTLKDGATVSFTFHEKKTPALTITGTLLQEGAMTLVLDTTGGLEAGRYALFSANNYDTANWTEDKVTLTNMSFSDLVWVQNTLYLDYLCAYTPDAVQWCNAAGNGVWNTGSANWQEYDVNYAYADGMAVTFRDAGAGTVTLEGTLTPSAVEVNNTSDYTFAGNGSLAGSMKLTKNSYGTLTIKTANSYTGGTEVNAGTIVLGHAKALGNGPITLNYGTIDASGVDSLTATSLTLSGGTLKLKPGTVSISGGLVIDGYTYIDMGKLDGGNYTVLTAASMTGSTDYLSLVGVSSQYTWEWTDGSLVVKLPVNTNANIFLDSSDKVLADGYTYTPGNLSVNGDDDSSISGSGSIAGSGSLTKYGDGTLTISTDNPDWTGSINVYSGKLIAASSTALGRGQVSVYNATLQTPESGLTLASAQQLTLANSTVKGDLSTSDDSVLETFGVSALEGDLALSGGQWNVSAGVLEIDGALKVTGATALAVAMYKGVGDEPLTLATYKSFDGDLSLLSLLGSTAETYSLVNTGTELRLVTSGSGASLVWTGAKGVWSASNDKDWNDPDGKTGLHFKNGSDVIFNSKATVTLDGKVMPGAVIVSPDAKVAITFSGKGSIAGAASLTMDGAGTLKLNATNFYTGGTIINAGTVTATGVDSFGTGGIKLNVGTLDLGGKAVANDITAAGGMLSGAGKYAGTLTVEGGTVALKGTAQAKSITISGASLTGGTIKDTAITMAGGTLASAVSGTSTLTVIADSTVTGALSQTGVTTVQDGATLTFGQSGVKGNMTMAAKGTIIGGGSVSMVGDGVLKLSAANTYTGGTTINAGTVTATGADSFGTGVIELIDGRLDLNKKAVENEIEARGGTIANGGGYIGDVYVSGDVALSGALGGKVVVPGYSTSDGISCYITLESGSLTGGSIMNGMVFVANWMDPEAQMRISSTLTGSSALSVTGGALTLDGTHSHTAETQVSSGSSLTVNGKITKSRVEVSGGDLIINGSVLSNIVMNGGSIATPKAGLVLASGQTLTLQSCSVTGDLTVGAKTSLKVAGTTRLTGNVVLKGGTWYCESGKLALSGGLTVDKVSTLDFSDFTTKNGSYTIATFKSATGLEKLKLGFQGEEGRKTYSLKDDGTALVLEIAGTNASLTWVGGKGKWEVGGKQNWIADSVDDKRFFYGDSVTFDKNGTITLVGNLLPGSLAVADGNVTFSGKGSIVGSSSLVKSGAGTLKLNATNAYTGGTVIEAGRVVATGVKSFGTGDITLKGGTLDLGKKAVANNILATGGTIANATAYDGTLTVDGDVALSGVLSGTIHSQVCVQSGSLSGGGIKVASLELGTSGAGGSVSINSEITGATIVSSFIDAELNGKLTYTGVTRVVDGTLTINGKLEKSSVHVGLGANLVVNGSVSKDITVKGGVLTTSADGMVLASGQTLLLASGSRPAWTWPPDDMVYPSSVQGSLTTVDKSKLATPDSVEISGCLTLNGGTWEIGGDATVSIGGVLSLNKTTSVDISSLEAGEHTLLRYGRVEGDWNNVSFVISKGDSRINYSLTKGVDKLDVTVGGGSLELTWAGGNGVWTQKGGMDWVLPENVVSDKMFYNGDSVVFNSKGTVTINGEVLPSAVTVAGSEAVTFSGKGSIAGSTGLTMSGTGTLKMNATNTYTGATLITNGKVIATGADSFGYGDITLSGGTLDFGGKAIANHITVDGNATILNGKAFAGTVLLDGGTLKVNSNLTGTLVLAGGTLDLSGLAPKALAKLQFGTVVSESLTTINVGSLALGAYTVMNIKDASGLDVKHLQTVDSLSGTFELQGTKLVLTVLEQPVAAAAEPEAVAAEEPQAAVEVEEALVTDNPAATSAAASPLAAYALSNPRVDGIIYTTQASAQIDGNRAAMDTVRDLMGGARMVVGDRGYRFALQATSANSRVKNDAKGMPGYNRNSIGGLLMVEKGFHDHMVAGLTLGHEHTDVRVRGLNTWRSNDTRLGAHLLAGGSSWRSSSYVGFGLHDYDMKRESATGTYSSKPAGYSLNMMEELAAVVAVGETSVIEPFLRVESSLNGINGTHERGGDADGALGIAHQNAWATTFTLGARYAQELRFGGAMRPARLALEAGVSKSVGDEGAQVDVYSWNDRSDRLTLSPAKRDRWGAKLGGSLILPISDAETVNLGASVHLRGTGTEVNANVGYSLAF